MYCPEAFITLAGIRSRIVSYAWKMAERRSGLSWEEFHDLIWNGDDTEADPIFLYVDAYSNWLLASFIQTEISNFFVCSPTGVLLKLSEGVIRPGSYSGSRNFPEEEQAHKSILFSARDRFYYIDPTYFTIDSNRRKGTELAEVLTPLEGWPVCWRLPSSGLTEEQLAGYDNTEHKAGEQEQAKVQIKSGRSRVLRETVIAAYLQECPAGPQGMTLNVLRAKVSRRIGVEVKPDTFRRAISEAEVRRKTSKKGPQKPL
jgi:hypothetical protein